MRYWIVRPVVNGYEMQMIIFGTESAMLDYIKNKIKFPTSYNEISYEIVSALEGIGFKVYCASEPENKNENVSTNVD